MGTGRCPALPFVPEALWFQSRLLSVMGPRGVRRPNSLLLPAPTSVMAHISDLLPDVTGLHFSLGQRPQHLMQKPWCLKRDDQP